MNNSAEVYLHTPQHVGSGGGDVGAFFTGDFARLPVLIN